MNKLFLTTLGVLFFSTSVLAQQMKEKKVCNTLENGAEFCTIFKVPVDNKPRKTADEINQDLAKQSELVFNKKEEKKSRAENKPQKNEADLIEVVDEAPTNREVKSLRANKKEENKRQEEIRQRELALQKEAEEAQLKKQEKELAKRRLEEEAKAKKIEDENRRKELAKKKLEKEEQLKAKKKEAEMRKKELAKKKLEDENLDNKKEISVEKETPQEKKLEKPIVQQEQQPSKSKPTFKDKENFSNFLSTIKNLE